MTKCLFLRDEASGHIIKSCWGRAGDPAPWVQLGSWAGQQQAAALGRSVRIQNDLRPRRTGNGETALELNEALHP